MKDNLNNNAYSATIHRLGRISTLIMLIALIGVPIVAGLAFGIKIDAGKTISAFFGAFSLFGIVGAIEFFSYAPILGAGGQYLSFITGNIGNMKMPAAISSIKLAQLEPGSKEADVISTIAIGISSIVTTSIILVGMIFIGRILPILQSPSLAPAFSNMMPALLGALATPILLKDIKGASVPCILAGILTLVLGYSTVTGFQSFLMPVFLIIAVVWKYILTKMEASKKAAEGNEA